MNWRKVLSWEENYEATADDLSIVKQKLVEIAVKDNSNAQLMGMPEETYTLIDQIPVEKALKLAQTVKESFNPDAYPWYVIVKRTPTGQPYNATFDIYGIDENKNVECVAAGVADEGSIGDITSLKLSFYNK